MHEILEGDCLEVMKIFPDNHFSGIVTDPPYGISFMGKGWDKGIPSIEYWQQMLRVTKPGGHLLAAGLPRMMHRLISTIEDSGWLVRDLLMHIFGSGFPKSHNHFGIEGYGTALKPAWEGWSLCMKPLDGTFKQNAEKWGVAGINIDGCRIAGRKPDTIRGAGGLNGRYCPTNAQGQIKDDGKGRWPANLILDEEAAQMLDEQSGYSTSHPADKSNTKHIPGDMGYGSIRSGGFSNHSDSGGASRFFYCPKTSSKERNEGLDCYVTVSQIIDQKRDLWREEITAVVALLKRDTFGLTEHLNIDVFGANITAQFHKDSSSIIKTKIKQIIESKTLNSSTLSPTNEFIRDVALWMENGLNRAVSAESKNMFQSLITNGEMVSALGVSNVALEMLSLISVEENWKEKKSTHPTVKPLALMRYLLTLIAPPENALILDPFAGSGSTILAAKQLGIAAIGIEKQPEYAEIARARIANGAEIQYDQLDLLQNISLNV